MGREIAHARMDVAGYNGAALTGVLPVAAG